MGTALLAISGSQTQPFTTCSGRDNHRLFASRSPRRQRGTLGTISTRAQADPDNLRVPIPPKSSTLAPSLWLSREDAVEAQLKALQHNNFPTVDHGIEVMYKFADIDPWARSMYFGRSLDLGQWERFRRIFNTKCFTTLLNHNEYHFISSLEVSEDVWKVRVLVRNELRKGEENVYEFTMRQRLGGRYDGYWYTLQLRCDGCDEKNLAGVI